MSFHSDLPSAKIAILSDANVERLKHQVAFCNPNHLNPDAMMNHILDLYFELIGKLL